MRPCCLDLGCIVAITGAVVSCRGATERKAPEPASRVDSLQATQASIERPTFRVCIESTGGRQNGVANLNGPLLLRVESISIGYSSSCSKGAVQCRVTGDFASWAVQVDYRVYTDIARGDPYDRAAQLAQACTMDLTRAPAYCVVERNLASVKRAEVASNRGSWRIPLPYPVQTSELCFGDNPSNE